MHFYEYPNRHLAVVGRKGHVATFDWQTGTLHSELQLGETCRDITCVSQRVMFTYSDHSECLGSYTIILITLSPRKNTSSYTTAMVLNYIDLSHI